MSIRTFIQNKDDAEVIVSTFALHPDHNQKKDMNVREGCLCVSSTRSLKTPNWFIKSLFMILMLLNLLSVENKTLFSVHITKYLGIILKASAAKIGWGTKSLDLLFNYVGIFQSRFQNQRRSVDFRWRCADPSRWFIQRAGRRGACVISRCC